MSSPIGGLVSGMDTTSMVAAMMKVEAAPQDLLKTKLGNVQNSIASYQSVNAGVAAMKSAADDLGQLSTWRSVKPTVSDSSVTVSANGALTTQTGSLSFDVVSLAKAQTQTARV